MSRVSLMPERIWQKGFLVDTRFPTYSERRKAEIAQQVYDRQQQTYVVCLAILLIVALLTGGLGE